VLAIMGTAQGWRGQSVDPIRIGTAIDVSYDAPARNNRIPAQAARLLPAGL